MNRRSQHPGRRGLGILLGLLIHPAAWAGTLYWGGGASDLTGPQALPSTGAALNGVWRAGLTNWAADPAGSSYQAWVDGSVAHLGGMTDAINTTNLLETDIQLEGLLAYLTGDATANRFFILTAASARTLSSSGGRLAISTPAAATTRGLQLAGNVTLAGNAALVKDGGGTLQLTGNNNAYRGAVTSRYGLVEVSSAGSATGVTAWSAAGTPLGVALNAYDGAGFAAGGVRVTAASGANDKLGDTAVVTLTRGVFDYRPAATSTETMGQLVMQSHGNLQLSGGNAGGVLTLAGNPGLHRGTSGLGTLAVNVPAGGTPNAGVRVPNSGNVPTNTLLPWITTSAGEFMLIDAGNNNTLTRIAPVTANANLAVWDTTYTAADNVRLETTTPTGTMDGDTTVNTLSFLPGAGGATIALNPGVTLTLASGAIVNVGNGNNARVITNGTITVGGEVDLLYVSTVEANAGSLTLASKLSGSFELVKSGIRPVILGGTESNDYTGATYVNSGELSLNKSGSAVAVPGDVYVRPGGMLDIECTQPFGSSSTVTVEENGLMVIGLASPTIGGTVVIDGGAVLLANMLPVLNHSGTGLVFSGGTFTHGSSSPGTLNLQTDLRYAGTAKKQAVFQKVNTGAFIIELDGAERVFHIEDSGTLASGVPEMVVDAVIANGSGPGSIRKTGAGVLQLTGSNTFSGGLSIEAGTVRVSGRSGVAMSGKPGAVVNATAIVSFREPVATNLVTGQALSGAGVGANAVVAGVLNDYEIYASVNSTNTGLPADLAVGAFSQSGTLGAGVTTVNTGGTLAVDAGISVTNEVALSGGEVVLNGALAGVVTWNSGTLGGTGVVVQPVTANGTVAPGASAGTLTFSSNLTLGAAAQLDIEWAATGYDRINVGGTAALDGELRVTLLDGFDPPEGSAFTALVASAVSGSFATTNLPPLSGRSWTVAVTGTEVILGVIPSGGGTPLLGVSPSSLDFGSVLVGAMSNLVLTLTNSGTASLSGTAVVGALPFTVPEGATYALAAGEATNVVIRFEPAEAGLFQDAVVLISDGGSFTNGLSGLGYLIASATNTTVFRSNDAVTLGFNLASGAVYRVEATTNLLDGSAWVPLSDQLTNRSGPSILFADTNSAALPQRAYRVRSP